MKSSVREEDIACEIPGEKNLERKLLYAIILLTSNKPDKKSYHCDYGLVLLCLVPLVSLHGEDVLPVREGSNVPGNIVAPAGRLDPMNTSGIHPYDVARFLQKSDKYK